MIGSLRGTLRSKSPTEITLDVNGVGYVLSVSLLTSHQLGDVNDTAHVLTHLHVREDALQLFGFANEEERHLFLLLISVSGIGPRTALGILSGTSPGEFRAAIARNDLAALMTFPNVGRKTAERLVLELRDKIGDSEEPSRVNAPKDSSRERRSDALMALTALGFTRPVAEKAIRNVLNEDKSSSLTVEEIITRALRRTDR
jgi:holliday junction DNA helicase RuvA